MSNLLSHIWSASLIAENLNDDSTEEQHRQLDILHYELDTTADISGASAYGTEGTAAGKGEIWFINCTTEKV